MKLKWFIIFLTYLIILGCNSKPSNSILLAFKKDFPDAKGSEWEKDDVNTWEVEFFINEIEHSANYDLLGKLVETEIQISLEEVPEIVMNIFKTKYSVHQIYRAYLEKTDTELIYEFELSNKEDELDIEIDSNGIFLIDDDDNK